MDVMMEDLKKKRRRGQLGGLISVVASIIGVGLLLVVGTIILGQLNTINSNNLGNNSNATNMIGSIFALLSTTEGVVVLVVVVVLLALALGVLLGAFGQGGRGR